MNNIIQYLLYFFVYILFFIPLTAQDSELNPDELLIKSPDPFIKAAYGLDGLSIQNYFDYARLETDTLRLGDDIRFSILDGSRLAINTALMIPGQFTTLDLSNLIFKTKGTEMGLEEWAIGKTSNSSNPPVSDFRIYRFGVGTTGGATFNTGLSIRGADMLVGIGNITPSQKLDVDGNARFRSVGSGSFNSVLNITSDGTLTKSSSDIRLKENITEIENSLAKTLALRGVSFNWRNDESKEKRIGLIAQEVEKVIPELVFTNDVDGYKGVRYQELSALLIEAIKEQQQVIEEQQMKIVELEKISARLADIEKILGFAKKDN